MMDIASILIMLVVMLILARIGFRVFAHFGVPGLIGEILVGVVIANLVIGDWSFFDLFGIEMGDNPSTNYEVIELFAEFGVIFLLFSVGLETKVKDLTSVGKAAMLVAALGVIVPFVAGVAVIQIYDGNMHHALFMGAAMVATSVGITARVIKDMRLMDTKESRIIIGAAVIDDILGMIVLAIVIGMTGSAGLSMSGIAITTIKAVGFVLVALALAMWVVPRIYAYFQKRSEARFEKTGESHSAVNKLILAIIVCLGFSWLADVMGLAAIIGAFMGGMLLAEYAWEWKLEEKIESVTTLFISFFFLNVGMMVDLGGLANWSVIMLVVVIVVLAVLTKYVGCYWGAQIGDKSLSRGSRSIIGWGMVPRGEVGIIVASIGLGSGAMSVELYAVVVIMAVATTIIGPPLFAKAFRKQYPPEYKLTPDDMI